jgi:hypothetical protein
MNDRFAMVSSDAANTYFRRPYEVFKKGEAIDKEVLVVNPETFLLNVYTAANVLNVFGSKHIDDVYRMYLFRSTEREPKYFEDDLKKPRYCPQTKEGIRNRLYNTVWFGFLRRPDPISFPHKPTARWDIPDTLWRDFPPRSSFWGNWIPSKTTGRQAALELL